MTPPSFPPETLGPPTQSPDYGSGASRRPPLDLASQLREWIDVLARGRWFVIAAVIAALLPAIAYVATAPNVYRATTYLYVETESGGVLTGVLPSDQAGAFGADRGISNELYILQKAEDLSASVAAELLRRTDTPQGEGLTILETEADEPLTLKTVADRVAEDYIRVRPDGEGANGVAVSVESRNPEEAALIANLYAQAYVARTQSSSRASVTASREFLETQADSVSTQLRAREEAARVYMDQQGAVRLDEEASNIVGQLADLEAERDQARVEAGMEAARIAELQGQVARLEANVGRRMGSGTDRELRQDEERLAGLRDRLETIFLRDPALRSQTPAPPTVAELRRQIGTLEARIRDRSDQLVDESIAAGGVDAATSGLPRLSALRDRLSESQVSLRGLRSRVAILDGRIAAYRGELDRIPAQTVELARLVRERESAERLALGLDQRLQEARVAESAELGYAEVIRAADAADEPVAPNRLRILILSLLVGLGFGVVLAVGRAQLDQALRRPAQLRDLGYPVLGVIPDVTTLINEDGGGAESVEVEGSMISSRLVTILHPMSTAAEAFRGLRTSIQFARPDSVVQTLLVTSPSPGEGKSTVAANLAVVMAQSGRRTLLVDADLRRPRVDRLFGMARSPGLTEYVSGVDVDRDLATVADDLDVLPAGELVPNPAEYLGSQAFRSLLDSLRETYDVIIIDAPPVMAATDPILLSTQMDATLLVTGAGKTKAFELEYAVKELQGVGGQVIGTVLNRFDVTQEYGYRYQYAYQYGTKYSYGHDAE